MHVTLVSCLCVSLFKIYLQQGVGMNIFGLGLSSYIFHIFFFLPVIEKLQHLFTFQHLGVSAVAQHYSILNTQRRIETAVSISSATQSHTLLHNGQWGLWTVWFHSSYFGFWDKKKSIETIHVASPGISTLYNLCLSLMFDQSVVNVMKVGTWACVTHRL